MRTLRLSSTRFYSIEVAINARRGAARSAISRNCATERSGSLLCSERSKSSEFLRLILISCGSGSRCIAVILLQSSSRPARVRLRCLKRCIAISHTLVRAIWAHSDERAEGVKRAAPTPAIIRSAAPRPRPPWTTYVFVGQPVRSVLTPLPQPAKQRSREYVRKLTTSLDEIRAVYPLDARKRTELSPLAEDYKPAAAAAIRLRKSTAASDWRPPAVETPAQGVRRHTTVAAVAATPDRREALEPIVINKVPEDEGPRIPEKQPERKRTLETALEEKGEENMLDTFPKSEGLTTAQAEELVKKYGRNELPEKVTPKWYIFLSLLWQPMPVMMWIAAAVEIGLKNYIDAGILIGINLLNACLSYYETTKAGDAVAALKASLKPTAICMRDGKWDNKFDARLLVPGDLIELAAGCAVPADCMVNHGQVEVRSLLRFYTDYSPRLRLGRRERDDRRVSARHPARA